MGKEQPSIARSSQRLLSTHPCQGACETKVDGRGGQGRHLAGQATLEKASGWSVQHGHRGTPRAYATGTDVGRVRAGAA